MLQVDFLFVLSRCGPARLGMIVIVTPCCETMNHTRTHKFPVFQRGRAKDTAVICNCYFFL